MSNRPQRFRKIEEIYAYQLDSTNGKDVAYWCGGKYIEESKNGAVTTVEQVKIAQLDRDPLVCKVGDYVVKNEDGSFRVIPVNAFSNSGFEPYFQRTRKVSPPTSD